MVGWSRFAAAAIVAPLHFAFYDLMVVACCRRKMLPVPLK
jgi:hypothetical protein